MKRLFIYFSRTENGEEVAKVLNEKGIELRKLEMKKPLPKSFFWGMMVGGFLATAKKKSELVDFDNNIDEYDEIILGSPIWNDRLSAPINGALSLLNLENKKVTFVLYSGGGEAKHASKRINEEYPNAKIIILKEPKKYKEELEKLNEI